MEAARPRVSQDVLLLAIKGPMAQRISRSVLTDQRIYENERQASRLGSARRFQPTQTHIIPSHAVWPRHANGSLQIHLTVPRHVLRPSRVPTGTVLSMGNTSVQLPNMPQFLMSIMLVLRQCGARGRSTHVSSTTARLSPCVRRVISSYCCPLGWPLPSPAAKFGAGAPQSLRPVQPVCSQCLPLNCSHYWSQRCLSPCIRCLSFVARENRLPGYV